MPPTTTNATTRAGQTRSERAPACVRGDRRMRRAGRGIAPDDEGDDEAIEQRGKEAGNQRRLEQLGDVLLGRDGVDDEDDGGRDEDAERAADGDRAGGEPVAVAVAPQLGQRRAPERGGGRDRRAADGAEPGAGADHRHGQAAAQMADEAARRLEQIGGEARALGEGAHQDEERDHRQRVVGEEEVGRRLHVVEEGRRVGEVDIAGAAGEEHRQAHRHAQPDQGQHGREAEAGCRHAAHRPPPATRLAVATATMLRNTPMAAQAAMA